MTVNNQMLNSIIQLLQTEPFNIKETVNLKTKIKMLSFWDSFKHLTFLIEIEKKFNLEISPDEIASIVTIRDLIKKINKNGYPRSKK